MSAGYLEMSSGPRRESRNVNTVVEVAEARREHEEFPGFFAAEFDWRGLGPRDFLDIDGC
jgi:hypothetical protein